MIWIVFSPISDRSEHCAGLINVHVELVDDGNRCGRIRNASIELHGLVGHIDDTNFLSKNLWKRQGRDSKSFDQNLNTSIDKEVPHQALALILIQAASDAQAGYSPRYD